MPAPQAFWIVYALTAIACAIGLVMTKGETYKDKVNVTFARGAAPDDPNKLFNSSLEGNVRRAIDIGSDEEIDAGALRSLIQAAAALKQAACDQLTKVFHRAVWGGRALGDQCETRQSKYHAYDAKNSVVVIGLAIRRRKFPFCASTFFTFKEPRLVTMLETIFAAAPSSASEAIDYIGRWFDRRKALQP